MKIYRNVQKCIEKLWKSNVNLWKRMEMYGNMYGKLWKPIKHLWKFMEIYGNVWKCIKMY